VLEKRTKSSETIITARRFPNPGVSRMADEKKLSVSEVRRTMATALGAAFGFVIALLWNTVVVAGLKVAGVDPTRTVFLLADWLVFVVTAVAITVFMIILIIVIGRWGNK
jgi:hypothetical protein